MPGDFGDHTPGDGSRHDVFGTVDPYAPSVANGGITPEQWAEYQKRRRRAAILGILGTVGGASAAGLLGSALGGGGAAASAGGASGIGAGEFSLATTPYLGSAAAGAPAAAAGIGGGAATAAGSAGLASAAGGGGAAAKGILGGLSARDLVSLGLTGGSMLGSALQDKPNMTPNTQTTDPNLLKLIQTMQGRLDKSEPLYGSILDMANGLLPKQYQKGGGGMP